MLIKRNYLKHLIDRYQEFAKAQPGRQFNYAIFYDSIKREFGAKWDMIPTDLFDAVCQYVQKRIDTTALGRNHKAHNQPNYSSFQEYCQKYVDENK